MELEHFTTKRLTVRSWLADIADEDKRRSVESALSAILSDRVLAHLPPPLQLGGKNGDISVWVDARRAESDVLLVLDKNSKDLIGLLIVASDPGPADGATIHFGYLLAEAVWGQGLATELVRGFVSALSGQGPIRLIGGVDRANKASARVLRKAGFDIDRRNSTQNIDLFVRVV